MHAAGERSEAVADRGMTQAQNAWESENRYNGNTTGGGYRNQAEYVNTNSHSLTTEMGTRSADGVRDAEALMTVQAHEVEILGVKTGSYHTSIMFKPKNQNTYKGDENFKEDERDGLLYTTIGGGPNLAGELSLASKRKYDMSNSNKVYYSKPIVSEEIEDQVFNDMEAYMNNYNNKKVEYDLLPNSKISKQEVIHFRSGGKYIPNHIGDSYNSNSGVTGLLNVLDIQIPELPDSLVSPGYSKPLPKKYFHAER